MAAKKTSKTRAKAAARTPRRAARRPKAAAKRAQPKGFALRAVAPSFTVNDVEKSLGWYRDVMGFAVGDRWESDGKLMGAELKAGRTVFMIGQDDWKKGRDRKKGEGFRIFCMTKGNVDALAKKIEAKGGRLDQGPTDQPWGVRDISLTDPDGFKLTIAAAKH